MDKKLISYNLKQFIYKHSFGFSPLPFYLAINIMNRCNRNCEFCPYHSLTLNTNDHYRWFKQQPDKLNYEQFREWIKRLGAYRKLIKHIAITGKGEPMLHKEFIGFCYIINRYDIPFSVTTNGDYLTIDLYNLLVQNFKSLTSIRVSIYDNESARIWFKNKVRMPKIELYNQTGKFIIGMTDGYTCWVDGNFQHTIPKDFHRIQYCEASFTFLTINTDQSIVPCYSFHEIGTLKDDFIKVWNGKKIRRFRQCALKQINVPDADCLNCGYKIERTNHESKNDSKIQKEV